MEESKQIGKNGFFWQKISKRTYTMAECLTAQEVTDIPIPENTAEDGETDQVKMVPNSGAENVCKQQVLDNSLVEVETTPAAVVSKETDNSNNDDDDIKIVHEVGDSEKKQPKADKKPATFGKALPISIQEMSRFANQTSKMSKNRGNSNFLFLTTCAKNLLPKPGAKPKITKKTTKLSAPSEESKSNAESEASKSNAVSEASTSNDGTTKNDEDTTEVKIIHENKNLPSGSAKIGNVKGIPSRDLLSISKLSSSQKKKAQSVDGDFLFLNIGANALLSQTGGKQKSKQKVLTQPSAAKEESTTKNENGKRPHSTDDRNSDDNDDRKYRSRNRIYDDDYFCRVCDIDLNSEQTWIAHIEGKRHQKKLALYQTPRDLYRDGDMQYIKKKDGCRINRHEKTDTIPKIQDQIEGLDEPRVGLNFVSEIWRIYETEDTYFCSLCSMTCYGITIINHVIGYKHRLAYLKLFDPTSYDEVKSLSSKKSELTAALYAHAVSMEKKYGPGQMKVEVEVEGYVAPFETGRIYQEIRNESSTLPVEASDLLAMPPDVKIKCIEETGASCDASEIETMEQFKSIERAVENLKATLAQYSPVDPMLNRRIVRFLQAGAAYKMDVSSTPVERKRFGPMRGYPPSPNFGFQTSSQVPAVGYEAERFHQMQGPSNYYMAQRNQDMHYFSTYFDGTRRPQPPSAYEAGEKKHIDAAVFDSERCEQMRSSHYAIDSTGAPPIPNPPVHFASESISQMYIPPYPYATERYEQPSATQPPFKPQPSSTGHGGVWGPI